MADLTDNCGVRRLGPKGGKPPNLVGETYRFSDGHGPTTPEEAAELLRDGERLAREERGDAPAGAGDEIGEARFGRSAGDAVVSLDRAVTRGDRGDAELGPASGS